MAHTYHFQNPGSGWPMVLRLAPAGFPVVNIEELDGDEPAESDINDAAEMSDEIKGLDIHDAALHLRRAWSAADIFD